jgi:hypothetical protein
MFLDYKIIASETILKNDFKILLLKLFLKTFY